MSAIPQIRRLVILLATMALVPELPSAIGQEVEPPSGPRARQKIADVPARYLEIVRVVHLAGPISKERVVAARSGPVTCEISEERVVISGYVILAGIGPEKSIERAGLILEARPGAEERVIETGIQ